MYKKGTFQALNKLAGSRHILSTNHFSSHLVVQTVRQITPCHMETAISKIREVGEYTVPSFELKADRKDNEISGSDLRTQAPKDSQLVIILYDSVFLLAFPKWIFQSVDFANSARPSCCNNCLSSAMVRGAEPPSRKRAEAAATVCDR